MDEKKRQKVFVVLSLDESDKVLIINGIKISSIFRKELCLLYNSRGNENEAFSGVKEKIIQYIEPIQREIPQLSISYLILNEKVQNLPMYIANQYEAILIIAPSVKFSFFSKALKKSPVPFLFVTVKNKSINEFIKIVVPVDLRKAVSECALWSSYFGRFNQSEIILFAANDTSKYDMTQVVKNVALTQRLFQKLGILHRIQKGLKSSLGNSDEALEFAHNAQADLLITAGSTYVSVLDFIVGLPERKIVKKAENLAIMVINPRIDNYMLCEECN